MAGGHRLGLRFPAVNPLNARAVAGDWRLSISPGRQVAAVLDRIDAIGDREELNQKCLVRQPNTAIDMLLEAEGHCAAAFLDRHELRVQRRIRNDARRDIVFDYEIDVSSSRNSRMGLDIRHAVGDSARIVNCRVVGKACDVNSDSIDAVVSRIENANVLLEQAGLRIEMNRRENRQRRLGDDADADRRGSAAGAEIVCRGSRKGVGADWLVRQEYDARRAVSGITDIVCALEEGDVRYDAINVLRVGREGERCWCDEDSAIGRRDDAYRWWMIDGEMSSLDGGIAVAGDLNGVIGIVGEREIRQRKTIRGGADNDVAVLLPDERERASA